MLNLRQVDEKSKGLGTNGCETVQKSAIRFNPDALIGNNFQDGGDESVAAWGSFADLEHSQII
jgi:hypothetical protein